MTKLRYFAWVRERIGKVEESYSGSASTLRELVGELRNMGEGYAAAFEDENLLRFALDQETAEIDDPIGAAQEIAIFPPMTGG